MSSFTPKLSLALKKKKKVNKRTNPKKSDLKEAFGGIEARSDLQSNPISEERTELLVIPAGENKLKFHHEIDANIKVEDYAAMKALQDEADGGRRGKLAKSNVLSTLVIQANEDTFQQETEQFKADIDALPEEPTLDSEQYRRVPIGDFGAAMLRGMGWSGDDVSLKSGGDAELAISRPHRLGLGATPKLDAPTSKRTRRPDQVKRQEALEKQQEEYAQQREKQLAMDKQRTIQNGSIVKVRRGKRARVLQLVGVPGLNMVKIQYEGHSEPSVVKRGEIDQLLSRDDLDKIPYKDTRLRDVTVRTKETDVNNGLDRKGPDRIRPHVEDGDRNRKQDRDKKGAEEPPSKKPREERRPKWAISNIRVRIVSERLGKRYFKEKGIVADVTPKGLTVELANGTVLDQVPERYLETAIPKVGGKAIVLTGSHRFAKGQLLERDSRKSIAVIQFYEDMHVQSVPLDDVAEWCGHLDNDLG
jgi:G patch domain and KOW motifs-containing protein